MLKKPLYAVSVGELGTNMVDLESKLSQILDLAHKWHAVLLIDEADVFWNNGRFATSLATRLYGPLDIKAKKCIWKLFIDRVRALPDVNVANFTEDDFNRLSSFEVNGREIKNAVRTAQSIALNEDETLSMKHLLRVLFVSNVFANDLKGPGYAAALNAYM
ncbi:hypothetical protein ABVK25_002968 [Lepraria finkii]|uniref:AAA+ ATPase lid domain-containing protein n=1 Tax=Lepraria finkii TaxID=1340010 RepID=A0ABR4BFI4_9LECA